MLKKQYEALKPYEQALECAIKHNFVRMTMTDFDEIMKVHDEIFKPLTKSQKNCSTCRLRAVKEIAAEYKKYKPVGRPPKIDLSGDSNTLDEKASK